MFELFAVVTFTCVEFLPVMQSACFWQTRALFQNRTNYWIINPFWNSTSKQTGGSICKKLVPRSKFFFVPLAQKIWIIWIIILKCTWKMASAFKSTGAVSKIGLKHPSSNLCVLCVNLPKYLDLFLCAVAKFAGSFKKNLSQQIMSTTFNLYWVVIDVILKIFSWKYNQVVLRFGWYLKSKPMQQI